MPSLSSTDLGVHVTTSADLTGLTQAESAVARFSGNIKKIGEDATALGTTLSATLTLPITGALYAGSAAAIDFNQKMELLHTQAGAAQEEVTNMSKAVLDLAHNFGQAPSAMADALYHIESVGYRGSQALDILKLAAEGAAVGQANLNDTSYALTSTLATGVKGAEDATKAMSLLNAIVGAGDMHMQDLNGAISTGFFAAAETVGMSAQSAGAALAYLTDRGASAQEAATRLRMSMILIAAPTEKASGLLNDIGISAIEAKASTDAMTQALAKSKLTHNQLADDLRQPNGLMVALQDLKTHLDAAGLSADDSAALIAKSFGGGRSGAAIMSLYQHLDVLGQKFDAIGKNANNFGEDWAKQQDTFKQKMDDFKASLSVMEVNIGNAFLPLLISVTNRLSEWADKFSHLSPEHQKLIVIIALMTATIGPLLLIIGKLISTFQVTMSILAGLRTGIMLLSEAGILGPVGLIAVIIAAAAIWIMKWNEIKLGFETATIFIHAGLTNLQTWFIQLRLGIEHALSGLFETITSPFRAAFSWIIGEADNVWNALQKALNVNLRHSPSLVDNVTSGVAQMKESFGSLFDTTERLPAIQTAATSPAQGSQPASHSSSTAVTVNVNQVQGPQDWQAVGREIGFFAKLNPRLSV